MLEPIEEKDLNLEAKFKLPDKNETAMESGGFAVEKEMPKEVAGAEKETAYQDVLTKIKTSDADDAANHLAVAKDAAHLNTVDPETHVQHLVEIALQKGAVHAVKVARHMDDNYILDLFHDRLLSDQLHETLIQKGIVKEI